MGEALLILMGAIVAGNAKGAIDPVAYSFPFQTVAACEREKAGVIEQWKATSKYTHYVSARCIATK